jgi:hypothetical protein
MRHWRVYFIATIALGLYGFGLFDYVMKQTTNLQYLSLLTEEQTTFFLTTPPWVDGVWAATLCTALLGALLMFWRSKFAATLFGCSLLLMCVSMGYCFLIARPRLQDVGGNPAVLLSLFLFIFAVFLWGYTLRKREKRSFR